jgi:serine/threonine-protein kinase
MEVFDRTADYDPNVDAIVRVEAHRLRAKLKAYYEAASDPVLIALRPGSYVPIFRWLSAQPRQEPAAETTPAQFFGCRVALPQH